MSGLDLEKMLRSQRRLDVQPFEHVRILGGQLPKVWYRYFAADFMASTQVMKPGGKRWRELTATGDGLEDALANLASVVADYLHPTSKREGR